MTMLSAGGHAPLGLPLPQKRLFLLDLDGTLYLDERLFPGSAEFLSHVRSGGGRYLFLSNNSSRGADAYVEKLRRLGIETNPGDYLTSVDALILFLRRGGYENRLFYAVGTASFCRQLRAAGFRLTDSRDDPVDVLICAFDTELTFRKLEDACILLGRGAEFLATNPDWVCPTWYGYVPDCGSLCEMLFRATGRRPRVIGKPQPEMALLAMASLGAAPEETLLVGDRLYTDIACAVSAGIDSALVLSGESTAEDAAQSEVRPAYIFQDMQALLDACRAEAP